ncbi:MAG: ABC transporter permease [Candidatus Edwardsbacteria bacterium]|nr:ABC transporter permease [Candidatus Edwardsbacteria bacterium]
MPRSFYDIYRNHLAAVGEAVLDMLQEWGAAFFLLGRIAASLRLVFKNYPLVVQEMMAFGINSLPLVLFAAVFTGMVAAVQAAYQMQGLVPPIWLGAGIGRAVLIELGPVLTALVVAGRVGAGIAAELGTMRVTEQIDALETMAIDPVAFLVMPRFVAGAVMAPVLTIFANLVALAGGWVVSVMSVGISTQIYLDGLRFHFHTRDLTGGIVKSVFFGIIIATSGCFYGFEAEGGAKGVGTATTKAVVAASVLILVFDYMISAWIFR